MGRTDLRTYVVEALDWMLPNASNSTESIVVLLDWYQGPLTEEVAEKVRRKGHVLIFHGGGCTPFTQINDTHLHALLAKLLIQVENEWAHAERGPRKVSLNRGSLQRLISGARNLGPPILDLEIHLYSFLILFPSILHYEVFLLFSLFSSAW